MAHTSAAYRAFSISGGDVSLAAKESRATKWCKVCLDDLGEQRPAHRIVLKSGGRCDEHFRYEVNMPQLAPEATAFIARWRAAVKEQERETAETSFVPATPRSASRIAPFVPKKRPSVQSNGHSVSSAAASSHKGKAMGRPRIKLDDSMIAEIRKDAQAGMPVEQIRKKRGIAWKTVKNCLGSEASNGRAKTNGIAEHRATNGALVTVGVDLLDRIWLSLPADKKAALLSTL